jgi:hypothetical protein
VLIKALYGLFVIGMAALVAVGIGVLLRVRRHLKEGRAGVETPPEQQEAAHPETDIEAK